MAHKEYRAAKREANGEPFTFTIGKELFEVTDVPAIAILDLGTIGEAEGDGSEEAVLAALGALRSFLRSVIGDENYRRFEKALRKERFDIEDLMPIVADIVSEVMGRPTTRSSDSPPPRQVPGPTSRDDSSQRATERTPSFT